MDVIHGLKLSEIRLEAVTTAYGPQADFLTIARSQARTEVREVEFPLG